MITYRRTPLATLTGSGLNRPLAAASLKATAQVHP